MMFRKSIYFYWIFSLLGCFHVYANEAKEESIKFVIPDFKPYTYALDGELKGIGVENISSIFKRLGLEYSLTLVPNYGRAVREVKVGRADVFSWRQRMMNEMPLLFFLSQ